MSYSHLVKNRLTDGDFRDWAHKTRIEYASETITNKGARARLVLSTSVAGDFLVTLGKDVLYAGEIFTSAASAYHGLESHNMEDRH